MKRLLTVLTMVLVAATTFAQVTELQSTESQSTAGLFTNELDTALNVMEGTERPAFEELDATYLFAGLSNIWLSTPVTTTGTDSISFANPIWAGLYMPGDLAWSLFTGFHATGATGNQSSGVTFVSTATKPVTVAPDTTNHTWVDRQTTTTYARNRLANRILLRESAIVGLGAFNIGLYLSVDKTDGSTQSANYTEVDRYYYDADAANAGLPPNQTEDYTITTVQDQPSVSKDFDLKVPVALRSDDMQQMFTLGVGLDTTNASTSRTVDYSETSETALGAVTETIANTDTNEQSTFDLNLAYGIQLPGVFGEDERNNLTFAFDATMDITSLGYGSTLTTQVVNYAGSGATGTADGERNNDTATFKTSPGLDLSFDARAGHPLYFSLGPVEYAFAPSLSVGYEMDRDATINSVVYTDRQDGPGAGTPDGSFDDADDVIDTYTYTYTNTTAISSRDVEAFNAGITATASPQDTFSVGLQLPMGAQIQIANWPFVVAMGSTPRVDVDFVYSQSPQSAVKTVWESEDGIDTDLGTTTTTAAPALATTPSSWDTNITLDAVHQLGLLFDLGEAVQLDVSLDFSSSAANILDFDELVVELLVGLP